jgi:hypothetical protein
VARQAARREDHAGAGALLLEHRAAAVERQAADIYAVDAETVEGHEHWRRRDDVGIRPAEQVVEYELGRGKLRDRGGKVRV